MTILMAEYKFGNAVDRTKRYYSVTSITNLQPGEGIVVKNRISDSQEAIFTGYDFSYTDLSWNENAHVVGRQEQETQEEQWCQEFLDPKPEKRKARKATYKRTNSEIDFDNNLVDKLLIHYYKLGKYVRLGTIIEYMQSQGRNWNEDNASNFMKIYIERTDKDAQRLAPGAFICTTSKKSKKLN